MCVVCCLVGFLLFAVCRLLFVACCLSFVVCSLLCCLLYVVACCFLMLYVVIFVVVLCCMLLFLLLHYVELYVVVFVVVVVVVVVVAAVAAKEQFRRIVIFSWYSRNPFKTNDFLQLQETSSQALVVGVLPVVFGFHIFRDTKYPLLILPPQKTNSWDMKTTRLKRRTI